MHKQPEGIVPGIYYNMPDDVYHGDSAISSTGLKKMLPEDDNDKAHPMEYWEQSVLNPDRKALDTSAMRLGRQYHTLVLQPEKFDWEVKAGIATSKVDGMIGEGDYNKLLAMKNEIMRSPQLSALLSGGHPEVAIFWIDEETGIRCRIKIDYLHPKWTLDLKSINGSTASKRKLRYETLDRDYDVSAVMYNEGLRVAREKGWFLGEEHNNFILLFQGKDAPYTPRPININDKVLAKAHEDFRLGLRIYKENIEKYGNSRWSNDQYRIEDLFDEFNKD